ncbi:hypothetical protein N7450_008120 [Penicillium hetheringtonii]|uniref:Uncharacterized protein n=1 Tax=Penicillium hetheringtonii TaxID=911720 RepID=A0AAD6DFJ7_9EURO|nr:hypothetical protein N7450_008120 [Penicillium hetheringtonii]
MYYSGPTKGHVEALEHRLQVTEGALLRLLSQVSDSQLSNAFPRDGATNRDGNLATYMPLSRLERRGADDWSHFPLDSAQNVRDWQHFLVGQSSMDAGFPPYEAEQSPVLRQGNSGVKRKHSDSDLDGNRISSLDHKVPSILSAKGASSHHHYEQAMPSPISSRPQLDQYWLSFEAATKRSQLENNIDLSASLAVPTGSLVELAETQPTQSNSSWEGAPSAKFQQQFLW